MIKKKEGRKFTPEEFRKLKQCITCGIADNIKKNHQCEECKKKYFKKCERCGFVLRNSKQRFYSYDIRDNRNEEVRLKVSVEMVQEYITEELPYYPQATDTLCAGCVDSDNHLEERIKNVCYVCKHYFENKKENYQLNGNVCEQCQLVYNIN